jgi:hypothetical protein
LDAIDAFLSATPVDLVGFGRIARDGIPSLVGCTFDVGFGVITFRGTVCVAQAVADFQTARNRITYNTSRLIDRIIIENDIIWIR